MGVIQSFFIAYQVCPFFFLTVDPPFGTSLGYLPPTIVAFCGDQWTAVEQRRQGSSIPFMENLVWIQSMIFMGKGLWLWHGNGTPASPAGGPRLNPGIFSSRISDRGAGKYPCSKSYTASQRARSGTPLAPIQGRFPIGAKGSVQMSTSSAHLTVVLALCYHNSIVEQRTTRESPVFTL